MKLGRAAQRMSGLAIAARSAAAPVASSPAPKAASGSLPAMDPQLERSDLLHAFARMVAGGIKVSEVISTLELDVKTASSIIASPEYEQLVERYLPTPQGVKQQLLAAAPIAAARLINTVMNGSDEHASRSAMDLLDRVGVGAEKQLVVRTFTFEQSREQLLLETLKQVSIEVGLVPMEAGK